METLAHDIELPGTFIHNTVAMYMGPMLQELGFLPGTVDGWEQCKRHLTRVAGLSSLKGAGDMRWMATYDGAKDLGKVRNALICSTHIALVLNNAT